MRINIKHELRHAWKYHKTSVFLYIGSLFYFGVFAVTGVLSLLYRVALPDWLLTGLICLIFGFVMLQIFAKQADDQYQKERKKEIPTLD